MARKASSNLNKNGLLSAFLVEGLSSGFNDARERTAPIAAKVGDKSGTLLNVPGRHGWFYAQRMGISSDDNVLIQFYADTDSDGHPLQELVIGQPVFLRTTSDTQPVHYIYDRGGDMGGNYAERPIPDPCTGGSTGIGVTVYPDGQVWFSGMGNPPYIWPKSQSAPSGGGLPTGSYSPYAGMTQLPVSGTNKYKTTPRLTDQPPTIPFAGDTWKRPSEGYSTRIRVGDYTNGRWFDLDGPPSGVFVDRKFASAVTPGKVVYETATAETVDLASNTNMACWGKVVGVSEHTHAAGEWGLVRIGGDMPWEHSFGDNVELYLGTAGNLTATPPAAGSGNLLQKICTSHLGGTSYNPKYIRVALGPCIKRR